jgi:hypothetical protein
MTERLGAHGAPRPMAPAGSVLLAPLRLLGGLGIALVLAVFAVASLGLALLLLPALRKRVGTTRMRSWTWSAGMGPRPAPGAGRTAPRDAGAPPAGREGSYAEVVDEADPGAATRALPLAWLAALWLGAAGALAPSGAQAKILVPMDDAQTDHLKAYGLTYWVLERGQTAEWLLNYRGGSFLLQDDAETSREANIRGVAVEPMGTGDEAAMRATVAEENMEIVKLEKSPKVAVYIPPNTPPWDDAVTLALEYASIPYATVWDEEVVRGDLQKYDWLHLHHEDFTAQHGKFYAAYHNFPWYQEEERVQQAMAAKLGFAKVTQLKAAVALTIREYITKGGFMFGMCSATDTYDIALSAIGVDIAHVIYDGDPPAPGAQKMLDYGRTLAFKDFTLEMDPLVYRFSDIDVTQEASLRGPNTFFTLFDFSAKNDPVPTMLIQNHVNAVAEFLGQTTGFRRPLIKSGVLALGEVAGTSEVKYLHGQFGRGTYTFLGGHDPEDYQHMVGDPATDLSRYKHSPGYRLILNNVLFPAAEKKKQRT